MRFLLLLAFAPLAIYAQKKKDPQTYAATITAADLKSHLYIVAGKEMEGRETGTAGERRAAEYIINHFKSIGVQPGNNGNYLMPFPVFRDSLVQASLVINDTAYQAGRDFYVDGGANSLSLDFSAVKFLGAADEEALAKGRVFGALVMSSDRNALGRALVNGAAAAIWVTSDFKPRPTSGAAQLIRSKFKPYYTPPSFTISESLARTIVGASYDSLKKAASVKDFRPANLPTEVAIKIERQSQQLFANNVLGMIEGTDKKDEYVFVTAHYDHEGKRPNGDIYYGADDDGSGTVTILELAEAFQKARAKGAGPRRTIVFMTVSGEEKGLWGSDYYSSHPVFPLDRTSVDLNIDMIGRIDPDYKGDSLNYLYTIGENKLSSDLEKITTSVNGKYTRLQIDRKFNDPKDPNRFYYRSDHYNFAKMGVPIIFYFNGVHADYHRPTDTPDKINYQLMQKRARLIFHTAWEIANREQMLKRDMPLN